MLLIVSEEEDYSTNEVIDWLAAKNVSFIRINTEDFVEISSVEIKSDKTTILLRYKDQTFSLDDITSVWVRRGSIHFYTPIPTERNELTTQVVQHLKMEEKRLSDFIHYQLDKKHSLGSKNYRNVNKLLILEKAIECGLEVPKTWIIASEKHLAELDAVEGPLITKGIDSISRFAVPDGYISNYTERISTQANTTTDKTFFPSLFQEEIKKAYELRIFFLDNAFYCMAIFSQSDKQTEVDFRIYNHAKPNRTVPYTLPDEIAEKLKKLMSSLNLNSGSLDMIVTTDKRYVFLEVNPEGQFGMTSNPCNYFLEEKIATYLSQI